MLIQWCLKGIAESPSFSDVEAVSILRTGLHSMWLRNNANLPLLQGIADGQTALNAVALDQHVNNYAAVQGSTPYISLSAGSVVPRSTGGGVAVRPAWRTALDFATRGGRCSGFVYRCWTIVSPKPSAGLPNISDEVRDLNLFRQFWIFHDEGEVAAKLLVPGRQIEWVQKVDRDLNPIGIGTWNNPDFVDPNDVSNLREAVA